MRSGGGVARAKAGTDRARERFRDLHRGGEGLLLGKHPRPPWSERLRMLFGGGERHASEMGSPSRAPHGFSQAPGPHRRRGAERVPISAPFALVCRQVRPVLLLESFEERLGLRERDPRTLFRLCPCVHEIRQPLRRFVVPVVPGVLDDDRVRAGPRALEHPRHAQLHGLEWREARREDIRIQESRADRVDSPGQARVRVAVVVYPHQDPIALRGLPVEGLLREALGERPGEGHVGADEKVADAGLGEDVHDRFRVRGHVVQDRHRRHVVEVPLQPRVVHEEQAEILRKHGCVRRDPGRPHADLAVLQGLPEEIEPRRIRRVCRPPGADDPARLLEPAKPRIRSRRVDGIVEHSNALLANRRGRVREPDVEMATWNDVDGVDRRVVLDRDCRRPVPTVVAAPGTRPARLSRQRAPWRRVVIADTTTSGFVTKT